MSDELSHVVDRQILAHAEQVWDAGDMPEQDKVLPGIKAHPGVEILVGGDGGRHDADLLPWLGPLATRSMPRLPSAPATFSTTVGTFHRAPSRSAITRPTISWAPPAGKPTMNLTVNPARFGGNCCFGGNTGGCAVGLSGAARQIWQAFLATLARRERLGVRKFPAALQSARASRVLLLVMPQTR